MAKRKGQQTPTKALILSTAKSLYKEAVDIYEKTGRKAQTWQKNLLKAILSRTRKGLWTHTKFGYSLPRRNGKSEILIIREMWGLRHGERILHTAHRTTTSHSAWEKLCAMMDAASIPYVSLKALGRERIEVEEGGRIEFRTRTSSGGLGEGFDLLVIDEAQEYTDDQASALKYVVTDSQNPQTLFCGTPPTPVSSGTVFTKMRDSALSGGSRNTGWAEWSVEEQSDPYDTQLWYQTNPSLGTIFTERSVMDEISSDTIDFNIQRLGLWLKYNQKSAISATDWESVRVDTLPKLTGSLFVGIKYGADGVHVALSIAVKTEEGKVFVEAVDCQSVRNGNQWLVDFLANPSIARVVIDGASGQSLLADDMKECQLQEPIFPHVKEIIEANAAFERAIYQKTLCHKDQPSLTDVVTNCEKRPIGTNGGFGYRSQIEGNEIALLDSVLLAHWACITAKPVAKQKVYY